MGMTISDDTIRLLDGVVGAVEATRYEHHMLWREYSVDALKMGEGGDYVRYSWRQGKSGLITTVGRLYNLPVCLSLLVDTVGGHRILFWHPTSQLVDYTMITEYLDKVLPERLNTDPMNFHNLLYSLPEKTVIWLSDKEEAQ